MIILYSGTPGSGKSLHCVKTIREYLLKGRLVVSNTYITMREKNSGKIIFLSNEDITIDRLIKISKYWETQKGRKLEEDEILLVLDEAQLLFNTRTWQGDNRMAWISFFSQHRKLGYQVCMIAQYIEMLDKQIRVLIEYDVKHRKVKNMGIWGRIFNLVGGGDLFIGVWYYQSLNLHLRREFISQTPVHLLRVLREHSRFLRMMSPRSTRSR